MFNFEEGEVILIDKPLDWTSFDTVNFIGPLPLKGKTTVSAKKR